MVPVGGRSLRLLLGEALNAALLYSIEVIIHIKPPSCLQRRSSILPGSFTNCVFLFSSGELSNGLLARPSGSCLLEQAQRLIARGRITPLRGAL